MSGAVEKGHKETSIFSPYTNLSYALLPCLVESHRGPIRPPQSLSTAHHDLCFGSQRISGKLGTSYFAIVIGIPTFSTLPIVVWNRILRNRNTVRSNHASSKE